MEKVTFKDRVRRWLGIDIHGAKLVILHGMIDAQRDRIKDLEDELSTFKEALKARSKASVFESDTIPDRPGKMAYVPVSRRRAQAEYASLGAKTHDDKVRENNVRAIENAG
jgi:hypothetical protein